MSELDQPFQTLAGKGESEHVVERSRFIGFAFPADSVEEALQNVAAIKSEHYDARHVTYGMRIGRGARLVDRSNDDGEPARTGGFPLWQILEGEGLTNAILVVVRYYGGIKLGTGGLARAYREAGRQALEDAGIKTVHPEVELILTIPYSSKGQVDYYLENTDVVRVDDTAYAADVVYTLAIRATEERAVRERLGVLLQRDPDEF